MGQLRGLRKGWETAANPEFRIGCLTACLFVVGDFIWFFKGRAASTNGLALKDITHMHRVHEAHSLFPIGHVVPRWGRNRCATNIIPLQGLAGGICKDFRALIAHLTSLFHQQGIEFGETQDELSFWVTGLCRCWLAWLPLIQCKLWGPVCSPGLFVKCRCVCCWVPEILEPRYFPHLYVGLPKNIFSLGSPKWFWAFRARRVKGQEI